jgi:WhiB family redox-sensing transcriptional regulator
MQAGAVRATFTHSSWIRHAACRQSETSSLFHDAMWDARFTQAAKDVCASCPARVDCLDYALRVEEPLGIWGGLDPAERRALRGLEVTTA